MVETKFLSARRILAAVTVFFAALTTSPSAKAYDVDTHFYEMYMMARYVGIGHEVALHLSTYNAYVDQSLLTSPMNPLPLTGERMRRLFHFPVPGLDRYSYGKGTKQHGLSLGLLDTAQENSPMGNELLWTGLKLGDMDMVGAGFHVLMDTYGHSDYSPVFGHIYQGHAPDRSYEYYEKHQRMTKTVLRVLALIRKTLPESALDKNFRDGEGPAHVDLSGDQLFEKYDGNVKIQDVIKRNTLRDPRFTRYVVDFMIREAKVRRVFANQFQAKTILQDEELWAKQPSVDEVVSILVDRALRAPKADRDQMVNMKTVTEWVMKDYGKKEVTFDLMPPEEKDAFIKEFARRIYAHIVPRELSKNHPVAFEYDHGIRKTELLIRNSDRQALIEDMFKTRVAFTSQSYKNAAEEISRSVFDGHLYDGIDAVDQMETRVAQMEHLSLAQSNVGTLSTNQRLRWSWKMMKFIYIDLAVGAVAAGLKKVGLMAEKKEVGNMRFDPSRGAALYQRERAFELMMAYGIVKKLATNEEIEALRAGHEKQNQALRADGLGPEIDFAIEKLSKEFAGKTLGELADSTIGARENALPRKRVMTVPSIPLKAPNMCQGIFQNL